MINIVINTSDEYAIYAGVMLLSLFENNPKYKFQVFVFSTSISNEHFRQIDNMAKEHGNTAVLMMVDKAKIETLPIHFAYHSINVYLRVLASDLLPREICKFIYFDCDIIINGDIGELWKTDVNDVALAATKDLPRFTPLYRKNLSLGENGDYFNSGVMIVNADYWRTNNVASEVFKFAEDNPDKIIACDQDAMNAVLKGKFKLISRKWNVYPDVFFENPDLFEEEYDELEEIKNHPIIIHFLYNKAWFYECRHPFKILFYQYYKLYTGKDFIPKFKEKRTFKKIVKGFVKRSLFILNIRKAYDTYNKRFVKGLNRYPFE